MPTTPTPSRTVALSVLLALLKLGVPAMATSPPAPALSPEVVRLLDLIEHRARLMPDVARWKWHAQRPIRDVDREAQVRAAAVAAARDAGLAAEGAQAFTAAQMAVARSIQAHHFAAWRRARAAGAPEPEAGPTLAGELRPAISATSAAILRLLPRVLPLLDDRVELRDALGRRLDPLGASMTSVEALADALGALEAAPPLTDQLARIRAAGELRVGTTGDYRPFSHRSADGWKGIDVDLARDLAGRLGVPVRFVPTTWPTLMADLEAGRFDIAMSGISRTLDRQRIGAFTDPYHVGGKTPIVRCADRERLADLASIDRPTVRVIVNPGGTNERFTRRMVDAAQLRVFPDNDRIFDEIAAGRADVMFTDAIEVRLRTGLDPRLCAAMPGRTLTYQEKGYLVPRSGDDVWLAYVELWLDQIQGDGTLERTFRRHLGEDAAEEAAQDTVDGASRASPRRPPWGTGSPARKARSMAFTLSGSSCCTQWEASGR